MPSNTENVTLALRVTIPRATLEKLKSVAEFGEMNFNWLLREYASASFRNFGKHEWDSDIAEHLTDEQLDEAIEELEFERDLRAEIAAEEAEVENEEPNYLDIEVESGEGGQPGAGVDPGLH